MQPFAATYDDVVRAAARLRGVAHRTPAIASATLDERTGGRVFLKAENLQRMGAFKFRGAYNRLVQLDDAARAAGVVAFSSGNHAQGVALAAKLLGIPATIVMPTDAPLAKLAATRGYGAEVVLYDRKAQDRAEIAQRLVAERGATLVPPYDDPMIIAGAGTTALELIEDVGALDVLLVCTGGGGLLSGCALAATALAPGIAVYGVEPAAGDDWVQSLARNERVTIPVPDTIADGMQTQVAGRADVPDRAGAVRRRRHRQRRRVTGRDAVRVRAAQTRDRAQRRRGAGRGAHRTRRSARQARRRDDQRRERRCGDVRPSDRVSGATSPWGCCRRRSRARRPAASGEC